MKTSLHLKQIALFLFLIPCLGSSYGAIIYNAHDSLMLRNMVSLNNNASILKITNLDSIASYTFASWVLDSLHSQYRLSKVSIFQSEISGDIELSSCDSLKSLKFDQTANTSLNLDHDYSLNFLDMSQDAIFSSLSIIGDTKLINITCIWDENLSQIDISNLPCLQTVYISGDITQKKQGPKIHTLKLDNDTSLISLYFLGDSLSPVDLRGQSKLEQAEIHSAKLPSVIFGGNPMLNSISFWGCGMLKQLDLSQSPLIKSITLDKCQLDNFPLMPLNYNGQLSDCDISNNNLPLSQIAIGMHYMAAGKTLKYAVQNPVRLKELSLFNQTDYELDADANPVIDLSSELNPLENQTNFIWHRIHQGKDSIVQLASPSPGQFNIKESKIYSGDSLYVKMANMDFPLMPIGSYSRSVIFLVSNSSSNEKPLEKEALHIYPNPCQSTLNIDKSGSYDWTIYNRLGTEVLKGQGENTQAISLDLAPGIYFLRVSNDKKAPIIAKFMVLY